MWQALRAKQFKIVIDPVNSTGALAVPLLLDALGCQYTLINAEINGLFAHNPKPLKEHLNGLSTEVLRQNAHLGIAVDPDVDRLVFMCEDGELFGEEYTLVAVADYVLSKKKGNTVSNLSSTRALRDVTQKHGGVYHAAAVGEVNVVEKMKAVDAVIGGEGNGGIIYPETCIMDGMHWWALPCSSVAWRIGVKIFLHSSKRFPSTTCTNPKSIAVQTSIWTNCLRPCNKSTTMNR